MPATVVTMKRKREDVEEAEEDDSTGAGQGNGHNKRLCKSAVTGRSDPTSTSHHATPESSTREQLPAVTTSETEQPSPTEPAKSLYRSDAEKEARRERKRLNPKRHSPKARNAPIKIPLKPKPKVIKLTPNRPYPTVPTSSNATGPKSKRKEGSNKICVTRRTELGAYLKQCRDVFIKHGYKELYLASMGAAIPHAVMLATSLPAILPYDRKEIKTIITTGSVSVTDEVLPVDEDDEGGFQKRVKASVEIVIRIVPGEGMDVDNSGAMEEYDSFSD